MRIGIVITCYNRPEYFEQCLSSIKKADIPAGTVIVLVNDASTDIRTNKLFDEFNIYGMSIIKYMNAKNSKVSFGLRLGFARCFEEGCTEVINLDSDAIVKPNFINVLLKLKLKYPKQIVTGFNCVTRNRNGSERHKIISSGTDHHMKQSVGGINMCINKENYDKWLKPVFDKVLAGQGNWDHMACIASASEGFAIVVSIPSVVQHIGFDSSMGHGSEEPDTADDFDERTIELPNVTLIGIDCLSIHRLIEASKHCTRKIKFGAVKLLTSLDVKAENVIRLPRSINSKAEYSNFMMKELMNYVDTDYCLVFQYDGYIINPDAWDNKFLDYDYIGATWWYKDGMNVGNGGFSLRSRKLLHALKDQSITMLHPEDHHIARTYRTYLETHYSIKFAPEELANKFSIEAYNSPDNHYRDQFGFHGQFVNFSQANLPHIPYKPFKR